MASSKALCNDLIRLWHSPHNFTTLDPVADAPTEIDHFIEVQHVVTILFSATEYAQITEANFFDIPVGFFVDLSTSISGHDNLFQISRAANTTKKAIDWDQYTAGGNQSQFIQQYMARKTTNNKTVGQTVEALAVRMATRTGSYAYLTRYVGQQICKKFNWDGGKLSMKQMMDAGDFTPPWGVKI